MSILFETDINFQRFIINECVDFRLACKYYGVELKSSKSGVCYCPFHYNKNTPSAKIYESSLYCFSENKSYNVSDLFDCYIVNDTIFNAFDNIWKILEDNIKKELKLKYEKARNGIYYSSIKKEFLPLLEYKRNKISYDDYCEILYQTLNKISKGLN